MLRLPTASSFVALTLFALALASACEPGKPPETPEEAPAKSADPDKGAAEPSAEPKPDSAPDKGSQENAPPQPGNNVPAGMSMDTYEMTPSDCNALGRHYGEVARNDQAGALSPKLNEKQRAATMDQIDKVVSKLEEKWTNGCHSTLVDHAVDHDAIKCALGAKSVKEFDTCLNGPGGTQQPAGKRPAGDKKKK
jgi:hypothetical protein